MVFKVPKPEFNPDRPFFIKRVAGLGGEIVGIDRGGDLIADGKKVEEPVIHDRVFYSPRGNYLRSQNGRIATPDDAFLAFGDNSFSSSDSRVWGPVPNENLKGLAFFRYWPRDKISFLD
jgi:signal peptidase I